MNWDAENWRTAAIAHVRDNPVPLVSRPGYFDLSGPEHEIDCTCWRCILTTARNIAMMVARWK